MPSVSLAALLSLRQAAASEHDRLRKEINDAVKLRQDETKQKKAENIPKLKNLWTPLEDNLLLDGLRLHGLGQCPPARARARSS